MVLAANAFYGLMLVLVHMMILTGRNTSDAPTPREAAAITMAPTAAPVPPPAPAPAPKHERLLRAASRHDGRWFWQVVDLDLAWAHGALGLGDWCLCLFGLLYGIAIIASSVFVLHAVLTAPRAASTISRWYMMFLHGELGLYGALVIVKLPLLCHMKDHFLKLMDEDCTVLRYMFFERAVTRLIIGSLCCWLFSSFAYLLAWGDPVVDDESIADQGFRVQGAVQRAGPVVSPSFQPVSTSPNVLQADKYALVGDPVSASFRVQPRSVAGSFHGGSSFYDGGSSFPRSSFPRASSSLVQGSSFAATGHAQGIEAFPRASSSMIQGDRHILIKLLFVIH